MTQLEIHNLNERVWTDIVEYRKLHNIPTSQDFDNKLEQSFINLVGQGESEELIHWMLMEENMELLRQKYPFEKYHNLFLSNETIDSINEFKNIVEDFPNNSSRSPEFKKELKELIKVRPKSKAIGPKSWSTEPVNSIFGNPKSTLKGNSLGKLAIKNSKPNPVILPPKKYKIVDFDDNILGESNDMESAIQCFLDRYPQFSKKHIHPFIIENVPSKV